MMEKEEFVELIQQEREMIKSGKYSECTCPSLKCKWHGDCYECVMMHRVHQKHLPDCLKPVLKNKLSEIAAKLEMHLVPDERVPDEYWDYLDKVCPEKNG